MFRIVLVSETAKPNGETKMSGGRGENYNASYNSEHLIAVMKESLICAINAHAINNIGEPPLHQVQPQRYNTRNTYILSSH